MIANEKAPGYGAKPYRPQIIIILSFPIFFNIIYKSETLLYAVPLPAALDSGQFPMYDIQEKL